MKDKLKYKETMTFFTVRLISLAMAVILMFVVLLLPIGLLPEIIISIFVGLMLWVAIASSIVVSFDYIKIDCEKGIKVRNDFLIPQYRFYPLEGLKLIHVFGSTICLEYSDGKLSKEIELQDLHVTDALHLVSWLLSMINSK